MEVEVEVEVGVEVEVVVFESVLELQVLRIFHWIKKGENQETQETIFSLVDPVLTGSVQTC